MCEGDNKSLEYMGTGVILKKHMKDHDKTTKEKEEGKLWYNYSSM